MVQKIPICRQGSEKLKWAGSGWNMLQMVELIITDQICYRSAVLVVPGTMTVATNMNDAKWRHYGKLHVVSSKIVRACNFGIN